MKDKKNIIDTAKNLADTVVSAVEELDDSALEDVTGAGNPFEKLPRVPTQPIDSDLRDKA